MIDIELCVSRLIIYSTILDMAINETKCSEDGDLIISAIKNIEDNLYKIKEVYAPIEEIIKKAEKIKAADQKYIISTINGTIQLNEGEKIVPTEPKNITLEININHNDIDKIFELISNKLKASACY